MESGLDRSPLALVHTHCIMGSSSHALFTFKDLPSYSELIKLGVQCYAKLSAVYAHSALGHRARIPARALNGVL